MEETIHVQDLAQELYSFLARRFPVCCASDEFTYFPQAVTEEADWSSWDDLTPDAVEDAVSGLRRFRARLCELERCSDGTSGHPDALASLLKWITQTLEEQFTLVRSHATQPTFALTVATVGLVQALQSGQPGALDKRLGTLPGFLEGASGSLSSVPELYRDQGLEMAAGMTPWFRSLGPRRLTGPAAEAVDRFADRLSRLRVKEDFRLAPDIMERVVEKHTGSALTLRQTLDELADESEATERKLEEEAGKLGYGPDWEAGFASVPMDPLPEEGKTGLLEREIGRLRDHCMRLGFLGGQTPDPDRLTIESLPSSLLSVRAADSYNARPGYPFKGGVFYIFSGGSLGRPSSSVHPVYRMTAAHEAYPGHHLLDLSRWNNPDPALRPIEYPLFYEGWACFGEDLMLRTGAFDRPHDRLILLRRRFRHAVRGRVDLLLHSGASSLEEAAGTLLTAGFGAGRARQTVRKYALRPAYQMCYTIGRRRFERLFDSIGQKDIPGFVNTVLTSGELLFEDLEKILGRTMGRGEETPADRNGETGKRGNGDGKQ